MLLMECSGLRPQFQSLWKSCSRCFILHARKLDLRYPVLLTHRSSSCLPKFCLVDAADGVEDNVECRYLCDRCARSNRGLPGQGLLYDVRSRRIIGCRPYLATLAVACLASCRTRADKSAGLTVLQQYPHACASALLSVGYLGS